MTHGTDIKLVNVWHTENAKLYHKDLNPSIDKPGNRWNIHHVSYDTLTSRAKPSSNGWLSHCAWSFRNFYESHRYKTKNSAGRWMATNARIGFKLPFPATSGFHSLSACYSQTMWMFSGPPEHPEDNSMMEIHAVYTLYSAAKSLMHAIRTEDQDAQQDVAHWMF